MATKNDPMPPKLSQIDDLTRPDHQYLTPEDVVFYWGEYHVGMGYDHGPTNNLIINLKHSPLHRGTARWRHKELAIQRIANNLRGRLIASGQALTIVPVPPSKIPGDPEYDDRISRIAQFAVAGTTSVAQELVRQTANYQASHVGGDGGRKTPAELMAIYDIAVNAPAPQGPVMVLDDVLTQGAHFRAVKDKIVQRFPATEVIGLMVARRVRSMASADDFDVL